MKTECILEAGGYIKRVGGEVLYTPKGKKIKNNIEAVIRKQMDKIRGMEVEFPLLIDYDRVPMDNMLKRGRRAQCMKVSLLEGQEYYLVRTCEELAAAYYQQQELKDCIMYQIKTKFRDEPAKTLDFLKRNEFQMLDIYSFEQGKNNCYGQIRAAFIQICKDLGIAVEVKESAEFKGQGIFSEEFYSLINDKQVEIAHIYDFNEYFAKPLQTEFQMGSYGMGIDRLFACFVLNMC